MANFRRSFFDMWLVLVIHVVFYVNSSLGSGCSITVECTRYRETFSNNVDMNIVSYACKTDISLVISFCDSYNLESLGITNVSKFDVIDLSKNDLMKIPILSNNTQIEINILRVELNPIKMVSQADFINIKTLKYLYLDHCYISKIEKDTFSNFSDLRVSIFNNPVCTCLMYNFAQQNKENQMINWGMKCPLWDDKSCKPKVESLKPTENNTIVCTVDTRIGDADIKWYRIDTNIPELLSISKNYAITSTTFDDHIIVSTIRIGVHSPCLNEGCKIQCIASNPVGTHSLAVDWPPLKNTFFSQKITIVAIFVGGLILGGILIVARFLYFKHFDIYESTKSDNTYEPSYGDISTHDQDRQSNGTADTRNTRVNGGGLLPSTMSRAPVKVLPALMPPAPPLPTHEGEGDEERSKPPVQAIYAQVKRNGWNKRRFQDRNEQEVPSSDNGKQSSQSQSSSSSASSSLTRNHSKDQRQHGQTLVVTAEVHSHKSYKMAIDSSEGGTARYGNGNSGQENDDPQQSQPPQESTVTLDIPNDDVNPYSVGYMINKYNGSASFKA